MRRRKTGNSRRIIVAEKGKIAFQLEKMCHYLGISASGRSNTCVIETICAKISLNHQLTPLPSLDYFPRLLSISETFNLAQLELIQSLIKTFEEVFLDLVVDQQAHLKF